MSSLTRDPKVTATGLLLNHSALVRAKVRDWQFTSDRHRPSAPAGARHPLFTVWLTSRWLVCQIRLRLLTDRSTWHQSTRTHANAEYHGTYA